MYARDCISMADCRSPKLCDESSNPSGPANFVMCSRCQGSGEASYIKDVATIPIIDYKKCTNCNGEGYFIYD